MGKGSWHCRTSQTWASCFENCSFQAHKGYVSTDSLASHVEIEEVQLVRPPDRVGIFWWWYASLLCRLCAGLALNIGWSPQRSKVLQKMTYTVSLHIYCSHISPTFWQVSPEDFSSFLRTAFCMTQFFLYVGTYVWVAPISVAGM